MKPRKKKAFWKSKQVWVAFIGLVALIVQTQTGWVVPPEIQAGAIMVIELILRTVTKEPIGGWTDK